MDLTYMIRGADGKEYGPASLNQITTWVQQGRILATHPVKRSDMEHWAAAGDFTELQAAFAEAGAAAPAGAPGPLQQRTTADPATAAQMKSRGSWFYWIAALSLINSIAALAGMATRFIFGLGVTQVFDAFGSEMASGGKIVAFILDLLAAGLLVFLGVFACKGHLWAFIVGLALLALDTIIFVWAKDWLGMGIHILLLFFLFRGFNACRELSAGK